MRTCTGAEDNDIEDGAGGGNSGRPSRVETRFPSESASLSLNTSKQKRGAIRPAERYGGEGTGGGGGGGGIRRQAKVTAAGFSCGYTLVPFSGACYISSTFFSFPIISWPYLPSPFAHWHFLYHYHLKSKVKV